MKYLISFPASAMDISDEEMAAVSETSHAVIREAKEAGLPLLAGTPRVRVRPRELTGEVAARCERGGPR